MAYDPEDNTPSDILVQEHFQGAAETYGIPDNLEPELKYIVQNTQTFQSLLSTIIASSETHTDRLKVGANNYALLSLGMDTVNGRGIPTRKIANDGYQYRVRTNLDDIYEDSFSNVDSTMKCREKDTANLRVEIETEAHALTKEDIAQSLNILQNSPNGSALPSVFHSSSDEELRVETLCMTSRTNYFFELQLNDDVLVQYHACADSNVFLTPLVDTRVGQDFEAEFEIHKIISRNPMGKEEVIDTITQAQDRLDAILMADHDHVISPSPASKLVRAAKAVARHYRENNPHLDPINSADKFVPTYSAAEWGLALGIKPEQLLTEDAHNRLNEYRKAMIQTGPLLNVPSDGQDNSTQSGSLVTPRRLAL